MELYPLAKIGGLEIRRIVIVADTVKGQPIQDSDGSWDLLDYDPTESSYFDAASGIDYGLLHEWGHAFGYLPDIYALDLDHSTASLSPPSIQEYRYGRSSFGSSALALRRHAFPCTKGLQPSIQAGVPQALVDVPIAWRQYHPGFGWGPIPAGLMGLIKAGDNGMLFDRHNILQIARRIKIGSLHSVIMVTPEASWGFPSKVGPDIPLNIVYEFDATQYKHHRIDVYQTDYPAVYPALERTFHKLTLDGARLDVKGHISIDQLFQNPGLPIPSDIYGFAGMYPAARAALLFKVYDDQNQLVAFTWSDIRLANIAAWMGKNRQAILTLPLATPNSNSPDQFAWGYTLRGSGVYSPPIFIPFANR